MHADSPTPMIIATAPNGARKTKKQHPNIPLTPKEIAKEARACMEKGSTLLHLHVRNKDGSHTLSAEAFKEAMDAVRKEVKENMIIQATSEACGVYNAAQQIEAIRQVRPEAVSLAIREIFPSNDNKAEKEAATFLTWLHKEKISPQYILYSDEDVKRFADLKKRGIIQGNKHFLLFVLGRYSENQTSSPTDLLPFLREYETTALHNSSQWAVCAFGAQENVCMLTAALLGGHARIGFENNIYFSDGKPAPTNADLIAQFRHTLEGTGRQIASIAEARKVLF